MKVLKNKKLKKTRMPKVKVHQINKKQRYDAIGNFFEIVSNLKSKGEVINFFVGLLTQSEAIMIARRIQIAQLLIKGDNYETICKKLKVGSNTVTKTERWLHKGDDKYCVWLAKCLRNKKISASYKKYNLLDKYAHHRFLKELFD